MKSVRANGIQFSYLQSGSEADPLVLCLHGFPDDAQTFAELLPVIAQKGNNVIAPYLRGYFPSDISDSNDYSVETLARDALALIEAFGYREAIVIGHDWGAIAGYVAANLKPQAIRKLVTLAIPHPRVLKPNVAQFLQSPQFYQLPWGKFSEKFTSRNQFEYLDATYRRWSPSWKGSIGTSKRMKQNFALPGRLGAALGYYRSFAIDLFNPRRVTLYRKKTSVPVLTLYGQQDGAVLVERFSETPSAFTGVYKLKSLPGAGHFPHLEKPVEVAEEILKFIENGAGE